MSLTPLTFPSFSRCKPAATPSSPPGSTSTLFGFRTRQPLARGGCKSCATHHERPVREPRREARVQRGAERRVRGELHGRERAQIGRAHV